MEYEIYLSYTFVGPDQTTTIAATRVLIFLMFLMMNTVLETGKMLLKEGRASLVVMHHVRQHSLLLIMSDSYCVGMFAGMVFFSLYLANKISVFRRSGRGHSLRVIIVLLPIMAAMIVAITRMRDYWHHWEGIYICNVVCDVLMFVMCAHVLFVCVSKIFVLNTFTSSLSPPDITVGALMGENICQYYTSGILCKIHACSRFLCSAIV